MNEKPCEECISRIRLLEHLENITMDTNPDHYKDKDKWYQANGFNLCKVGIEMYVKDMPPVTPQQKVGYWITTRTFMHDGEFYCDNCKCDAPNNEKWDYCPNCGVKMEVEE